MILRTYIINDRNHKTWKPMLCNYNFYPNIFIKYLQGMWINLIIYVVLKKKTLCITLGYVQDMLVHKGGKHL